MHLVVVSVDKAYGHEIPLPFGCVRVLFGAGRSDAVHVMVAFLDEGVRKIVF